MNKHINVSVDSFYISKYELTQGEYERVMQHIAPENYTYSYGQNRGSKEFKGDSIPVIGTLTDIIEYCNHRSEIEGYTGFYTITDSHIVINPNGNGYRLPTQSEWLYAAHAGNLHETYKYAGSDKANDVAWWGPNSQGKPHKVGLKKPNGKGLYDMSGNATEFLWATFRNGNPDEFRVTQYMDYEGWVGKLDDIVGTLEPRHGARIVLIPKGMKNQNLTSDMRFSADKLIKDLKQ